MAHIYRDEPKKAAYKRAANTIAGLDRPVSDFVHGGQLEKLPGIGPAIGRIILEYLRSGTSDVVTRAYESASHERRQEIEKRRGLREHYLSVARARQILALRLPGVVGLADYNGDLQQHSVWSDGTETLEAIVENSIALGQRYAAITDHFALAVANGLRPDEFVRQHKQIDEINDRYAGRFRMLKGVEANIVADGTVDALVGGPSGIEIVVAAPHSLLQRGEDQTRRLLAAVQHPGVHILGHPRGRRFNARSGVRADWERVFDVAARRQVAIEIDGTWERQDVDYALAAEALRAGCLFALDSDAHTPRERQFSAIAVAHARLADIPPDRVINCWPLERLLDWARARG